MRLRVWVQPKSRRPGLVRPYNGGLRVSVKAAPEKGQANDELLAILSKRLGVPENELRIVGGATSRQKWLEVPDSASKVLAKLVSGS